VKEQLERLKQFGMGQSGIEQECEINKTSSAEKLLFLI